MRALEFSPTIFNVSRDSLENLWCLWQKIPSVGFYDAWKSNLVKCGRGSMTCHTTPQAHLKPRILWQWKLNMDVHKIIRIYWLWHILAKFQWRIINEVPYPRVMMMSIFYGIFELKILYSPGIEISENGINGGKYDLGN